VIVDCFYVCVMYTLRILDQCLFLFFEVTEYVRLLPSKSSESLVTRHLSESLSYAATLSDDDKDGEGHPRPSKTLTNNPIVLHSAISMHVFETNKAIDTNKVNRVCSLHSVLP
jgi:hypothetical protein